MVAFSATTEKCTVAKNATVQYRNELAQIMRQLNYNLEALISIEKASISRILLIKAPYNKFLNKRLS